MDWTSPEDYLLFLVVMIVLLLFRRWNTDRRMKPLRALFDGGRYEVKGTGLLSVRYVGRFKGRRAVVSFDPRAWGRPGNFDLEIACRAPWDFYVRTLLREKIAGWSSSAGKEVDIGDPALAGRLAFHSDTPDPLLRWFGDPEVGAAAAYWLLEEDAVFLTLRKSRYIEERTLMAAYITTLPPRTEADVRILLDRLGWLAEKAEWAG